jgi:hypothetical protein
LAGISRVMTNPDIFQRLRSQTVFRGRKNFDRFHRAAKIAGPGSEKSHQLGSASLPVLLYGVSSGTRY